MHLKFYRDQKYAARKRMHGREETFDVDNEDDWNDFLVANGEIRPCKSRRKWTKFIDGLVLWSFIVIVMAGFYFAFGSLSLAQNICVVVLMVVFAWWFKGYCES